MHQHVETSPLVPSQPMFSALREDILISEHCFPQDDAASLADIVVANPEAAGDAPEATPVTIQPSECASVAESLQNSAAPASASKVPEQKNTLVAAKWKRVARYLNKSRAADFCCGKVLAELKKELGHGSFTTELKKFSDEWSVSFRTLERNLHFYRQVKERHAELRLVRIAAADWERWGVEPEDEATLDRLADEATSDEGIHELETAIAESQAAAEEAAKKEALTKKTKRISLKLDPPDKVQATAFEENQKYLVAKRGAKKLFDVLSERLAEVVAEVRDEEKATSAGAPKPKPKLIFRDMDEL